MQLNKETEVIGPESSLEEIEREGVFLYIEERSSSASEIYRECFNEEAIYMPDYVMDNMGRLKELRYHKISYI